MIDKLLKIREDFRYAISLEDRTLLGFALNDLDTFLHKNKQALNIASVTHQREQLLAFAEWFNTEINSDGILDNEVEDYLRNHANNCG